MANLTITVDEAVLRQARMRALAQGKSVNSILADYLKAYADVRATQEEATRGLMELSRASRSGRGGRRWTRDDLHER